MRRVRIVISESSESESSEGEGEVKYRFIVDALFGFSFKGNYYH